MAGVQDTRLKQPPTHPRPNAHLAAAAPTRGNRTGDAQMTMFWVVAGFEQGPCVEQPHIAA